MRTTGSRGGVHYLQYSFAPRLFIFNAFLQSLIGLHDFGQLADDDRAREALRRRRARGAPGDPALSDVGDWSLYNYAGHESTATTTSCCASSSRACARAGSAALLQLRQRYRGYQTDPPGSTDGSEPRRGGPDAIRFNVSKLSAVEVKVTKPNGKLVFNRLATFRRGAGSFTGAALGRACTRERRAKELRTGLGNRTAAAGDRSEPDPEA